MLFTISSNLPLLVLLNAVTLDSVRDATAIVEGGPYYKTNGDKRGDLENKIQFYCHIISNITMATIE